MSLSSEVTLLYLYERVRELMFGVIVATSRWEHIGPSVGQKQVNADQLWIWIISEVNHTEGTTKERRLLLKEFINWKLLGRQWIIWDI